MSSTPLVRRLMSWVLAICLIVPYIPSPAYAAEDDNSTVVEEVSSDVFEEVDETNQDAGLDAELDEERDSSSPIADSTTTDVPSFEDNDTIEENTAIDDYDIVVALDGYSESEHLGAGIDTESVYMTSLKVIQQSSGDEIPLNIDFDQEIGKSVYEIRTASGYLRTR